MATSHPTSAPIAPLSLTAAKQTLTPSALSPSAALLAAASHSYLSSVSQLTTGSYMLKFPFSDKGGKPERRYLFYAVDEAEGDCLYWTESDKKKKRNNTKSIPLREVTGLLVGWQTAAFRRAVEDRRLGAEDEGSCMSVVGKRRTLDLQAGSRDERDRFIAAVNCVMTHKQLNLKQQATAVATARRQSIIHTNATIAALSAPNSPLAAPLNAAAAVAASTSTPHVGPRSDMFVISVKARNLPIMPWRDDDGNDTLVCVYAKTTATGGQFTLVESSEWQHSNAMPNFRTPLLVPIQLPILPSDLIKLVAYDSADDDSHVIGSVVVRAEFFMKNAGHEMMVKLKNSAQPAIEKLLGDSNTYLLLTSTCKTGGGAGGGGAASGKGGVNVATKQQFGSVMAEFQTALQKGKPTATVAAAANVEAAANAASKPAHARSKSVTPRRSSLVADKSATNRSSVSIKPQQQRRASAISPQQQQQLVDVPAETRARQSSIQLPKTTMSFLQAGDSFTFYPPKKGCTSLQQAIAAPCKVSVALKLRGDFGELQMRQLKDEDDDDDDDEELNAVLLTIPFELVYQAKLGTAPGCFYLPTLSHRRPKAARCLSLLIKTSASADAKIDYWLDLECRTNGTRDAWVQAVAELTAYIHMPVQNKPRSGSSRAAQRQQTIEVESIASTATSPVASAVASPVSSSATSPVLSPKLGPVKQQKEAELPSITETDAQPQTEKANAVANVQSTAPTAEVVLATAKPALVTAERNSASPATGMAVQPAEDANPHLARHSTSDAPAHWDDDSFSNSQSVTDAVVFVGRKQSQSTNTNDATVAEAIDAPYVRFSSMVAVDAASSALAFLDPQPTKRSPLDVARKTGQKGVSNILQPTATLPASTTPVPSTSASSPFSSLPAVSTIPIPPVAPVVSAVPILSPPGSTKEDDLPTDDIIVRPLDPADVPPAPAMDVPAAPSFDGPPPPPGPPSAPGMSAAAIKGPRLKRLHWYAVNDEGLEGTVWREEANTAEEGEEGWAVGADGQEMLVSLFAVPEGKVAGKRQKAAEEESKARSIFDGKRNQNIEIALRAFRMPHAALHEAVVSMDMTILNQERITSLIACCPTTDELVAMAAWQSKQPQPVDNSLLPQVEQFAFLMHSIPRYQLRLRAMLFRLRYAEMVDGLCRSFTKLSRACRAIRDSKGFRRVLRLILSIGNVMNRTASQGFHLSSLDELQRTRSQDGQANLVDFIVRYLQVKRGGGEVVAADKGEVVSSVGALAELASVVHGVCVIDVQQLLDDRAAITLGLQEITQQLAAMQADMADSSGSDSFVEQMNEFLVDAKPRANRLHDSYQSFNVASHEVLLYLNEVGELTVSEVFQLLDRFCLQVSQAEQRYVERRKAEMAGKHRRVQTMPAPASLSVVMSNVSVADAMRAHAEKRKESTWDD